MAKPWIWRRIRNKKIFTYLTTNELEVRIEYRILYYPTIKRILYLMVYKTHPRFTFNIMEFGLTSWKDSSYAFTCNTLAMGTSGKYRPISVTGQIFWRRIVLIHLETYCILWHMKPFLIYILELGYVHISQCLTKTLAYQIAQLYIRPRRYL